MSFPQKVKSTLWAIVDSMFFDLSPFVKRPGKDLFRERKLGIVRMIRFCICMQSGCISKRQILRLPVNR